MHEVEHGRVGIDSDVEPLDAGVVSAKPVALVADEAACRALDIGDHVLMQMGAFLKDFFRDSDKVFRTGGEEFLILVYNTDEANSIDLAEKLRRDIENLPLIPGRMVTVSIGVVGLGSEKDWKKWMKTCDKNLYEAKNRGRNRVVAC